MNKMKDVSSSITTLTSAEESCGMMRENGAGASPHCTPKARERVRREHERKKSKAKGNDEEKKCGEKKKEQTKRPKNKEKTVIKGRRRITAV